MFYFVNSLKLVQADNIFQNYKILRETVSDDLKRDIQIIFRDMCPRNGTNWTLRKVSNGNLFTFKYRYNSREFTSEDK